MKLNLKLKKLLIYFSIYFVFFNPILSSQALQKLYNHLSINYFKQKRDDSDFLGPVDQLSILFSKALPDLNTKPLLEFIPVKKYWTTYFK